MIAFVANKKQYNFFQNFKRQTSINIKIIKSKEIFKLNLKAIKYLNRVNFSNAIDFKIKTFYTKHGFYIPKIILKFFYTLNAIFCFMRYFTLFNTRPSTILVWNGLHFRQAIILEIAKIYNIKSVFFETAFLPNRFVMDNKGINFYNSIPRNKGFFLKYENKKPLPKNLTTRTPKNVKKFSNPTKNPLPDSFIFVPFQVEHDTQILLFSPWIRNMKELFFLMKDIGEKLNLHIVFKEHPSSKRNYHHLHQIAIKSKYIRFANFYSTQELIQKCQAVVTINSSVGIESLLFYKKVITIGKAFYNINDVVRHVNSQDKLLKIMQNLEDWKIDKNLIKNFLTYLYWDYLIPDDFSNIEKIKTLLETS